MRILVLSDTHGNVVDEFIKKIKKEEKFDMLIHCGDFCKDASYISNTLNISKYIQVKGNCDWNSEICELEKIDILGKKIFVTHGHLFSVKKDLSELKNYAKLQEADIVFFGHTHKSYSQYEDGILFFNPGSACIPTYGKHSYGKIIINDTEIFDEIVEW